MSIPALLFLMALILGLIALFRAQGESLTDWAVCLIAVGLLWGLFR